MTKKIITLSLIASCSLFALDISQEEITLDPIVVSSDFREKSLSETSNAITVLSDDEISDKASQSFIETVSSVPNVNFSSGASKAKYIQIRGMGETGQFETPLNPTVALLIDGINFSNATLGASLFDIKQVEVLRGPQGTKFGANAIAGVITVQSNEPTKETNGHIETTIGNYNTKAVGAAVGGTLVKDKLLGRFSIYKNDSDGFITNETLNKTDTNKLDELTAKTKFKWLVSDGHTIDLTTMYINNNNGYDIFNQSNDFTTQSNEPGKDTQKTNAYAIKSIYEVNENYYLESSASYNNTDTEYSYDEDWTEFSTSTDQYLRDKEQYNIDIKAISDENIKILNKEASWVIGTYYNDINNDLTRNYYKWDNVTWAATPGQFTSNYKSNTNAIYGQLNTILDNKLTLLTGARVAKLETIYSDSDNEAFNDKETLSAGKLGLSYKNDINTNIYATLSSGYKPGGFNPVVPNANTPKHYESETLWNIDLGLNKKLLDNSLVIKTNIFYGERQDHQVATSTKQVTGTLVKYNDYILNAPKSTYYGLETEFNYIATPIISFDASLGLLNAKLNDSGDLGINNRTPSQSPKYQYNIGTKYIMDKNWTLRINAEGKDEYYFSNSHNQKAESYTLLNTSIKYKTKKWSATIWAKNITNTEYSTRGYYFDAFWTGSDELFVQQGSPRTFGFTLGYDF